MILVTGASGQIGSYVLEEFLRRHDVVGLDLKRYPFDKEFEDLVIQGRERL